MNTPGSSDSSYLIGQYQVLMEIGKGGFSCVLKAIHLPTKLPVAIKKISKAKFPANKFERELAIMKRLDNPCAISFFEFFEDDEFNYLVMEDIPGNNLQYHINKYGPLPEWQIHRYFYQLIDVLDYIHNVLHIAHRDLKVENIMLDENMNIRLIDFGLGNQFRGSSQYLETACGSPAYAPPEMFRGLPYTISADLWSAGIVLYAMAYGRLPFEDHNINILIRKIVLEEPLYPNTISQSLKSLISSLLTKDTDKRIKLDAIKKHPFVHQYEFPHFDQNWTIMGLNDHFIPDPEVVKKMEELGPDIDINASLQSVENKKFDSAGTTYRILRRKQITNLMGLVSNKNNSQGGFPTVQACRTPMVLKNKKVPIVPQPLSAVPNPLPPINPPTPLIMSRGQKKLESYKNITAAGLTIAIRHNSAQPTRIRHNSVQ